jgi:hypothetical protein
MNLPKRPEDAHATLTAAFNTGDVATVMSMYDVSGLLYLSQISLYPVRRNLRNLSGRY